MMVIMVTCVIAEVVMGSRTIGHMDALTAQDTEGIDLVLIMDVQGVLSMTDTMVLRMIGVRSMVVIEGEDHKSLRYEVFVVGGI